MEDVKIASVACGWRHSIAADSNGTVYTFGWSKYGQLGHGDTWWAAPFTGHRAAMLSQHDPFSVLEDQICVACHSC